MLLFLLTIAITSLLVILFKLFVRWQVDVYQAIVYNYLVCLVLGSLITWELPYTHEHITSNWFPFVVLLGTLFIIGFNVAAETVRYFGVALTSVVQRMSLVLSAGFAIVLYSETLGPIKAGGIALALVSIVLINYRAKRYNEAPVKGLVLLLLPILTWLLGGMVESTLYYLSTEGLSAERELEITTMGFGFAGGIGLLVLFGLFALGKKRFSWRAVRSGLLLGIPNYFSIYLIFLLLKKGYEGSVIFPILNISVLAAGALSGVLFFHEKLKPHHVIGIAIALLSILLISLS